MVLQILSDPFGEECLDLGSILFLLVGVLSWPGVVVESRGGREMVVAIVVYCFVLPTTQTNLTEFLLSLSSLNLLFS